MRSSVESLIFEQTGLAPLPYPKCKRKEIYFKIKVENKVNPKSQILFFGVFLEVTMIIDCPREE